MVTLQIPVAVALITLTLVMPVALIFVVYKLIQFSRAFRDAENENSQRNT
jgi:hypothetical protein